MNPRVSAVLFAIALVLGAFIFFYELREDGGPSATDPAVRRIFSEAPVDPDQVESISLTTEDGTPARVERREGRWWLVEPVAAAADQGKLDGIAKTLVSLASEGVIEEPQEDSVYGLEDATRVLRFRAGGREYGLRVGIKTPIGPNSYVASISSDQVFIVSTWKIKSLAHSLLDLRDRRVLPFDPSAVVRLTLRWPGGGATLERNPLEDAQESAEGLWRMVAPAPWRGDDSVIDTLLSDLSFLRAESFVDDELDDSQAGLETPVFEASLDLASSEPLHFALGSFVGATGRVARGRDGLLFRVSQELLADLPRRLIDYRYKQLSNFESPEARSIALIFHPPGPGGAVTVSMERTEEGWTATSGEALAAGMTSRLVRELAGLKAVDIVAESMGAQELAALGLSPANATFRVFGAPGEDGKAPLLCEILLGTADPSRGILARAIGKDAVYRLDYALADEIPVNYGAFVESFASVESTQQSQDLPVQ